MPVRLVIFDCDGVLVDSERLSHEVLLQMLAEEGVHLTLDEAFERFMGASHAKCEALVAELVGGSRGPAAAEACRKGFGPAFQARCFEAFSRALQPVPGVPEVLDTLRAQGLATCVASNGPHAKMRFTLGQTGLLDGFAGRLFSADDVARPKPAPDLFLHAAASLGMAVADCVVIEDSATGVAAARAAGMPVLGFAAMGQAPRLQQAGATQVFGTMGALPGLLESLRPAAPHTPA